MSFISVDLSDFDAFISLLDEKTKDENIHKIVETGLKEGFKVQQNQIKNSWNHSTPSDPKISKTKIKKKKTEDFILYDDTPLWSGDYASLGTGFLFDNSIDPRSRYAEGGIIAQYLAYGTKTDRGSWHVTPDTRLKAAIASKAIKDKANKAIEEACIKEFEKIFKEMD